MKKTLMVKLDTAKEEHTALLETMNRFNEACNYISEIAFSIRAISKVSEVYKRDRSIKPGFRIDGAVVYDQRILSWKGLELVSILSINGRLKIPVIMGEYQQTGIDMKSMCGQTDLILRNGIFYLAVVVEVPEPSKFDAVGSLGVDLGIVNLATDSDGDTFSGKQIDEVRERNVSLRSNLQKAGTKSAKRHLKKLSGRERRFQRDINHNISKKIVAKAKDTGKAIALEDLTGIRTSTTVRKTQRSRHSSWAFRQMRSFIEYKATLSGVSVILVNPRGTSHTCPVCGHNERRNRPNRDTFRCIKCDFSGHADHIAAINIAARAAVNQPVIACDEVKANIGIEMEHSYKPLSGASNMPSNSILG